MSTEIKTTPQAPLRYKQRFSTFMDSRKGKMFGVAEVAALAGSSLVLFLVLLSYLYFLVPARSRVNALSVERQQLETNLKTLQGVVSQDRNTKENVERIAASLDRFEIENLLLPAQGRMELYDELNQLIVKNGLRNTSGPTYTTLDPSGTKTVAGKSTTTKWQSFYPGVVVMVTVEGEYANVRRFIRDIERSRQFVVINEVELQRATENNAPATAGEAAPGSRGSQVSLQLNMATYFQRSSSGNNTTDGQE